METSHGRYMTPITLDTPRLILRPWRDDDADSFAAMFADPAIMEFLGPMLDRAATGAVIGRIRSHFAAHGFGWWAAELRATGAFIGFIGLSHIPFEAPFTPAIEIGWRLAGAHWGRGYATEGARAALACGFSQLGLAEIVSLTVPANARSRRVMERIGMTHDPADDFDHPRLPEGDPLRRHVLYRISRARWEQAAPARIAAVGSADDLAAAIALFRAYAASLEVDLAYQDFAAELAAMPGKYAPPSGALLLARDVSGTPIGCVGLRPIAPSGCCEMKRLYVAPAGRGSGLGERLVQAVIAEARRIGYREMRLDTLPTMTGAIALYRKLGFAPIAPYYETPVAGTQFLRLRLDPA